MRPSGGCPAPGQLVMGFLFGGHSEREKPSLSSSERQVCQQLWDRGEKSPGDPGPSPWDLPNRNGWLFPEEEAPGRLWRVREDPALTWASVWSSCSLSLRWGWGAQVPPEGSPFPHPGGLGRGVSLSQLSLKHAIRWSPLEGGGVPGGPSPLGGRGRKGSWGAVALGGRLGLLAAPREAGWGLGVCRPLAAT